MSDYAQKKNIERTQAIPDVFPLQCYLPYNAIDEPPIMVGMDSGVTNNAFASLELIQKNGAVVDFKYNDAYYYENDLAKLWSQIDKQIFLCNQYFNLFSHKNVECLTFEVLPVTSSKKLQSVLAAQATTNIISLMAYQLHHTYKPIPPKAIKYCLTGDGNADKDTICQAAFSWTKDEKLLCNNHMADAFACAFYSFFLKMKDDCKTHNIPVPDKYARMYWNFKKS